MAIRFSAMGRYLTFNFLVVWADVEAAAARFFVEKLHAELVGVI